MANTDGRHCPHSGGGSGRPVMRMLRSLRAGLRVLFRKQQSDQELQEELQGYLDAAATDKLRAGMEEEQARRVARLELGSIEAIKEEVRGAGWESVFESCAQDLRYGVRT